jgi:outer membrane protein OmpA-like peptidoglycan-associated protein
MRRTTLLVALALGAAVAAPLEAQVTKKIRRAVGAKVDRKKAAVEDSLARLASSPVDTALARAAAPLEEAATEAARRLARAVAGLGPGDGRVKAEEARIEQALEAGQADLAGVVFLPGAGFLDEGSAVTLAALRAVLRRRPGEVLVRARAGRGEAPGDPAALARQRAEAVRAWLAANGIDPKRIRTGGVGTLPQGAAAVTVIPLQ